jgi:hypothetical protein
MKIAGSGGIRGESVCGYSRGLAGPDRRASHLRRQHLTMQVARLLDPHPRTFGGKLRQLWRALQLEWHYQKARS